MCTVFYRVEFLNIFQHRVESTVVFRSSFNTMARGTHRRKKVDEKSCVTPAGTSNELDVHNEWEENTHTLAAHFCTAVLLGSIRRTLCLKLFMMKA